MRHILKHQAKPKQESWISSIEEIIQDAQEGRMFILVDHEARENEGDLILAAEKVTPEAINFMAKYGRGLICLALTKARVEELDLPLMPRTGPATTFDTAFTVSIEAAKGVTTGISAADRAHTISVAIDPKTTRADLITPGHIFPLLAKDGGVLARKGHTEAAVDIARLAGLNPSGVICEIMNDDGTMARLPDLLRFAQFHNIKVGTIEELEVYRAQRETCMMRSSGTPFFSAFGGIWQMVRFHIQVRGDIHSRLCLIKGDLKQTAPILTYIHQSDLLDVVLGILPIPPSNEDRASFSPKLTLPFLHAAMERMGQAGHGIVILEQAYEMPIDVKDWNNAVPLPTYPLRKESDSLPTQSENALIVAQIFKDLAVTSIAPLVPKGHPFLDLAAHGFNLTPAQIL